MIAQFMKMPLVRTSSAVIHSERGSPVETLVASHLSVRPIFPAETEYMARKH